MPPFAADGAETVYAAVSDYSVRTFSRADAPEPEEPRHVRASCCARLAGPAMGFVELPDRTMRWSPVPRRGHAGIHSWTPAWICMRCQAELPAASVSIPLPRPACHCCRALMVWEVDLRLEMERWVCSRCPAAGPARPLELRPLLAASPMLSPAIEPTLVVPGEQAQPATPAVPATPSPATIAPEAPATPSPSALARGGDVTPPDPPAPLASEFDGVPGIVHHTLTGPPHVPLRHATYSCVYMPLLLDAAGMLDAQTRAQWRAHPSFAPWWQGAVTALLARPFLSIRHVRATVDHYLARPDGFDVGRLQHFLDWSSRTSSEVTSLAALVRAVGRPQDGYYLPGPLQEALLTLLTLLLGEVEAAALGRLLDGLRVPASVAVLPVGNAEPEPDVPACSGLSSPAHCAGDSPQALREAVSPEAVDAISTSRPTVPLPAHPVGPAESELPAPQAEVAPRPRLQLVWGSPRPTTLLDQSDSEGSPAAPPNARAETSDLHLANTAGLAATSEARARGRGRRGGRGRGRRAAAAAEPELPLPRVPRPEPVGEMGNSPPRSTASQRRVAAAEAGIRAGLASLDAVPIEEVLRQRVLTLQAVPARLRGALRTAFRTALQLIHDCPSPQQELQGWKLFLLAPRMLLYRAGRESRVPPNELDRRCEAFNRGEWPQLLQCASAALGGAISQRADTDELQARAARAAAWPACGRRGVEQRRGPLGPPMSTCAHFLTMRMTAGSCIALPSGLRKQTCRARLLRHCVLAVSWLCKSQTAGASVPSSSGTFSDGLLAARLPKASHLRACLPHQYGLSTRAGTEALTRVLRTAVEVDPRATILSVDAIGAFDHVSRQAMLGALSSRPGLQPLLPYARQFYGAPSVYTWVDGNATSHEIAQGEGGEQGDPLMPALHAIAQQPALHEVQAALREGEAIFAYLDDTYIVAAPERVKELYECYRAALWSHARVELNFGKTRIWNAAGEEPRDIADLQQEGGDAVWVGDWSLPPEQQGLVVLGAPIGSEAYVQRQLRLKRDEHDRLLQRIPAVEDLQAAWLLLRHCACPRANYLLRALPPASTAEYASAHDEAVAYCLATLLGLADAPLPPMQQRAARLPLRFGGLGLREAIADRHAAYWASWMDTLPVIHTRAPGIAARLLALLRDPSAGHVPSLTAAVQAAAYLSTQGFEAPGWGEALEDHADPTDREDEPGSFLRGWQHRAARACDERALETHLPELSPSSRALLLSQAGPHAARVFTVLPTWDEFAVPSSLFRILILRRLRLALPLGPSHSSCRCALDVLGDHRAACATSGVLASRALPLERAIARVCQEAGARVGRNVRLAALNLHVPVHDARRIEVVCNGLPFWHGAQVAVDATIVSPIARDGTPQPRANVVPGTVLRNAANRKRRQTYPELGRSRRCRLVVFGVEVGGRWAPEAAAFLRMLARARAASAPPALLPAAQSAWVQRWSGIISVAAQRALASSLLELPSEAHDSAAGTEPALHELLADARWHEGPAASRMPHRA